MTRHDPAEAGPSGLVTCSEDTSRVSDSARTPRRTYLRLTWDLDQLAREVIDAIGAHRAVALGERLAGPLRTAEPTHRLTRVTWSAPWWEPTTYPASRMYSRRSAAYDHAHKLVAKGYDVEIAHAERTDWRTLPAEVFPGRRPEVTGP